MEHRHVPAPRSERRRRAHPGGVRRVGVLALGVWVAVALPACGRNSPVGAAAVATVNGHDVSPNQVRELVDAQIAFAQAIKKTAQADPARVDQAIATFRGTGTDTYGTAGAASVVSSVIDNEVAADALARAGGKVTKADRDGVRSQIADQLRQQGVTKTASFQALVDLETERAATRQALTKALTTGDRQAKLRAAYDAQKAAFVQVCVEPIVTAEEAAATKAVARVKAGEDYTKVAGEVSAQPPSGDPSQDVPCVAVAALTNVFGQRASDAGTGDLLGPAQAQGQWLVVRVQSRKVLPFEDQTVQQQLQQSVPDPTTQAVADALARATKRAEVTVDPRYGTWDPKAGVVQPPEVPGRTTTTTTVAATAASTPGASAGG